MARVHVGYFEDFKGGDTVLLEGDDDGLHELAESFRELAAGTIADLALHDLSYVQAHRQVRVTASRTNRKLEIRRVSAEDDFLWESASEDWRDAADKLDVLVDTKQGHQYLVPNHDELTVQASKNEYGDGWWRRHG